MDFRKATDKFADKDFDGDPVVIYKPGPDDPVNPPDDVEGGDGGDGGSGGEGGTTIDPPLPPGEPRRKYVVGDVEVTVVSERVKYYGNDGKLITESLKDYTKKTVHQAFTSMDEFLNRWREADQKKVIIQELEENGVLLEALAEEVGRDYGPFDLICHVVYDQPPLTRRERANNVLKRDYFTKHGDKARKVLEALLDKFADEGIENIESMNVLKLQPLDKLGTPLEIVKAFGGKKGYQKALKELEDQLYVAA